MSTSIIIHRKNGIGRLNLFDEMDGVPMSEIKKMAQRWSSIFTDKIEIVETQDRKCVPNFAYTKG